MRALVEECLKVGEAWGWEPAEDSAAGEQWCAARLDPLARTLAEADAHAVLLLRSGLEHAVIVAQALSSGRAFVPLTVARTAAEHCLRAQYLLDPEVAGLERAGRRLNDWLYAVTESERQRVAIVKAGHPRSEEIKDATEQLAKVDDRAAELGLTVSGKDDRRHIVGVERRPTPMVLGERYLSDPAAFGVTSTVFRTKNAVTHGLETGLLAAAVEVSTSYEVQSMKPQQMEVGLLAFSVMSVPLAVFNATRAMAVRFGRGGGDPRWEKVVRVRDELTEVWGAAISAHLDEIAPDRPRTGLFGPLER